MRLLLVIYPNRKWKTQKWSLYRKRNLFQARITKVF